MRARTLLVLVVAAAACGGKKEKAPRAAPGADGGRGAIDAAAVTGPPAAADCDAALAHLRAIMPHAVVGDAEDRADCLRLPRRVVLCLAAVESEKEADRCVADAAAGLPFAPAPDPGPGDDEPAEAVPPEDLAGEEECKKAVAHLRAIAPELHDDPAAMVKECRATATRTEVKCLLGARTQADVDGCARE